MCMTFCATPAFRVCWHIHSLSLYMDMQPEGKQTWNNSRKRTRPTHRSWNNITIFMDPFLLHYGCKGTIWRHITFSMQVPWYFSSWFDYLVIIILMIIFHLRNMLVLLLSSYCYHHYSFWKEKVNYNKRVH